MQDRKLFCEAGASCAIHNDTEQPGRCASNSRCPADLEIRLQGQNSEACCRVSLHLNSISIRGSMIEELIIVT